VAVRDTGAQLSELSPAQFRLIHGTVHVGQTLKLGLSAFWLSLHDSQPATRTPDLLYTRLGLGEVERVGCHDELGLHQLLACMQFRERTSLHYAVRRHQAIFGIQLCIISALWVRDAALRMCVVHANMIGRFSQGTFHTANSVTKPETQPQLDMPCFAWPVRGPPHAADSPFQPVTPE
jgi:hypothetical protein